jgi:DNA-binding transcriptional MerR regulator
MRPQKEKTFSISDLRKEFNVTSRTIRYYEDISLLNPNRCGKSRIYSPADRTRLKLILRGKRLGLSLEDSRQIIDMYEPGNNNVQQLITLINAIREQRKKLNR